MRLAKAKVHFVGIGGVGMCGLAELLHNMGTHVTGSDLSVNANVERLRTLGIQVYEGHKAQNVGEADVLVYSSAVNFQNPEMLEAKQKKIPIIARAEVLAEIMLLKRGVAVGGTHGKTTTTSMTASIFLHAKMDPTIVVGGRLDLIKSTALLGQGQWLIAEADESDGSFLKLSPEIAVITNIDDDHLDYYKDLERLEKAFLDFALRIPFFGLAVVCGDDPKVKKVFSHFPKRIITYGFETHNDLVAIGENGKYEVRLHGQSLGILEMPIPGKHNALNALAALAVGLEAGIGFETCMMGLQKFTGVGRRFQLKGEVPQLKIPVYDDYAHHPTEIRATLQAFKEKFPSQRLVVLFQPHRYSRTQICWEEFTKCFTQADLVLVTDIYPAGEASIANVNAQILCAQIQHPNKIYIGNVKQAYKQVLSQLRAGDVFVTLGAGDVNKVGVELCGNHS